MLEKALPGIPAGHPLHKEVLSSISRLTKHAPPQAASPGIGQQALMQMAQQAMQNSPLQALLAGQQGGGGAAGGGTPPMPMRPPTQIPTPSPMAAAA